MKETFTERIKSGKVLLFDGGLGTLLASLGGSMISYENNLQHPEIVLKAHQLYREAGSNILNSNTFVLNGINAARQGLSIQQTADSVAAAMEIVSRAADGACYISCDLGPAGEMLKPMGSGDPEAFHEAYCRQISSALPYHPDVFTVETVFDLNEAKIIAGAVKELAPETPLLMSLTFSSLKRGGCTIMGHSAAKIAAAAKELGAVAVGGNCGDLTPAEYAQVLTSMQDSGLALMAQPNAGKPVLQGEQVIYPLGAEEFALQMEECYAAGARILGGCCGTTPDHIRTLAQRFGDR